MENHSPVHAENPLRPQASMANAGVIDLFAYDQSSEEVLLVMNEARPWDGGDEQLHQVQEKFNAYASFVLDGEMLTAHPELSGKSVRIELRSAFMPEGSALELLRVIHDQLELQAIKVEVVVAESSCGDSCQCLPV